MLKTRKRKETYVPYCPRCKGLDICPTLVGIIGGTGFRCKKCGYRGFCPEIEVEKLDRLKKLKKKIKRKGE